jgi:hypothetical protein
LSVERLRTANNCLACFQERKEQQAAAEFEEIPRFEEAFKRAVAQAERGDVLRFEDIAEASER